MYSLTCITAGSRTLLIDLDGAINAPFSIYLNEKFDNPHTREAASTGLRLFHRFLIAHRIDLPSRALNGECLRSVESGWLTQFAYRPVEEAERMSDKMIKRLTVASQKPPNEMKGAVEPNTAVKRLHTVADFLEWYRKKLLDEAIRSSRTRAELKDRYAAICADLKRRIRGTTQGHHHEIRSLPVKRYLQIIRELVLNPEQMFRTNSLGPRATVMRDRAMALLAAEGIRPGAIGNLTVDDFRYRPGDQNGYVVVKDNVARRGSSLTTAVPTAKGTRSIQQNYNSNVTVRLWPFTCLAIKEYLDGERAELLGRRLANRSKSFLFLADHGGPIGDRTTIAFVFRHLGERLKDLGLLDVAPGDPFVEGTHYEFSAYTLRHSAVSLFYASSAHQSDVKDLMRERFGWTENSTMPDRYAKRAMSEAASLDMQEFHEELLQMLAAKKQLRVELQAHGRRITGNV
ncbi:hypothetical protein [Paraburkholderia youngii]|uniref:Integrase n=1 Tax=Paraburkholderia youngii TaxID=2782701 RepID=A0A7W8LCE8_9BURK|nr:hypothetical protein [Paraburkholderia youngii]MBB5404467.1 integrase [Paraburkholderia youngii]